MKRRDFLRLSAVSIGGTLTLTTMPSMVFAQSATRLKYDSYVTEHASPSVLDRWFLDELVKTDDLRAKEICLAVAEKGQACAMIKVSELYKYGQSGFEKDLDKSKKWEINVF